MNLKLYIAMLLAIVCLHPCAAQKKQHGKASYYSKKATGAKTASGQRLHHDSLTCAHRFYPFGTMLKVTNLSNSKSVVVKVIDRGPFGRGRIIDLSYAAAKSIGMLAQGVATVKVEMMDKPIPYKPEDTKLPQIDFEVAESDYDFPIKWKKEIGKAPKKENVEKIHRKEKNEKAQEKEKTMKAHVKEDTEKSAQKHSNEKEKKNISISELRQEHKNKKTVSSQPLTTSPHQ